MGSIPSLFFYFKVLKKMDQVDQEKTKKFHPSETQSTELSAKQVGPVVHLESVDFPPQVGMVLSTFPGARVISHKNLSPSTQQNEYRSLLMEAKRRGYRPGWAAYRFKDRFGQWPEKGWG